MRILTVLCVCSMWSQLLHGASLPDVVERIRGGVVGIGKVFPPRQPIPKNAAAMTFRGTGFVVGNGLLVVTNAHVVPTDIDVDNREALAVFSGRGANTRAHRARVLALDDDHDLAVLSIQPPALPALQLGDSSTVREGQSIALTGFPIGVVLGLYPATHRGIVASVTPVARVADNARTLNAAQLRRMRDRFDTFQLDVVAYPGNSGSPVYESDTGRVIGVLNSVLVKQTKESLLTNPSGIGYAIPVRHVQDLLEKLPAAVDADPSGR
jgi:S1-C subfamily serine protease